MLATVRNKESEKSLTAQRLQYLKERETSLQEFLQKAGGQLKGLDESIHFTSNQIKEDEEKLIILEDKLEDLKYAVEEKRAIFDQKRSTIDELRKENQAIQRHQFDAEKKVAVADTSIQNLQRTIIQIQEEKSQRQAQLQQLEIDRTIKADELEQKKIELQQLQDHQEFTKEQIFQTQSKLEILRSELADESRKLDSKKNEHALLKSLVDSMEGYPESVKFLHKNTNWNHEAPLLSDVIYVQQEYRAAVENVLEPYLNYYVVNNLEEGLKAIHLLDDNKKGKANFFLLDKLNEWMATASGSAPSLTAVPANTFAAVSVAEIDSKYASLAKHLLGNVFIAENDDALINSDGAVILEKTGKYVKGNYSLTGGSVGLFEGKKIGRAKNLEKLIEEIAIQEKLVNQLKVTIQERHNEVIAFNEQLKETAIKQAQQDINNLTNHVFSIQNKIENLHHLEETSSKRVEDLQGQLEDNHDAIASTREELEKLNTQLEELTDRMQAVEQDYAAAEQEYNFATATYNDNNLQYTKQQSKVLSLKQEFDFKSNQLKDLTVQVESSSAQLAEAAGNIAATAAVLAELEALVVTLLLNKDVEEKKLNEADQAYYNIRNALAAKESELRQKQKSKEGIDNLLNEIKDKLTELKLQLAGMKERLQVEFRIDLDDIIDQPRTTETPLPELQDKNDRMRKRLENIGEVNPTAIEAYTEMKKRYEFILEQKNDLVTAKDSLMQTIQEVEATANQQFLETFNKVRENFQKVFKALFTEDDTADMVLVDPENLADTGIDIVAKPKGKRPSSIGQLSGGEKTLTATALLFAIYLIKPAPFCILDEVDAPLDDANVGKFTKMIKQFSENSQFIIVTHNKQTMSAVDVIYGVTMQEPGVSKLVPVDFRSLN
jgi:chromosome segregation protein